MSALVDLAESAGRRALHVWGGDVSAVTHLYFGTMTGGMDSPSIDIKLVERLGLDAHVERTNIEGMGCLTGYRLLNLARTTAQGRPDARILVIAADVRSALGNALPDHADRKDIISAALFRDGASAAVVSGAALLSRERPLYEIVAGASTIVPGTGDLVDYAEEDGGSIHLHLSKDLPKAVGASEPVFVARLRALAAKSIGKEPPPLDEFDVACHTGGPRVLAEVAASLCLSAEHLASSWAVMRSHGNLSGASNLCVLDHLAARAAGEAEDAPREWVLCLSMGPGVCLEGAVLRRCRGDALASPSDSTHHPYPISEVLLLPKGMGAGGTASQTHVRWSEDSLREKNTRASANLEHVAFEGGSAPPSARRPLLHRAFDLGEWNRRAAERLNMRMQGYLKPLLVAAMVLCVASAIALSVLGATNGAVIGAPPPRCDDCVSTFGIEGTDFRYYLDSNVDHKESLAGGVVARTWLASVDGSTGPFTHVAFDAPRVTRLDFGGADVYPANGHRILLRYNTHFVVVHGIATFGNSSETFSAGDMLYVLGGATVGPIARVGSEPLSVTVVGNELPATPAMRIDPDVQPGMQLGAEWGAPTGTRSYRRAQNAFSPNPTHAGVERMRFDSEDSFPGLLRVRFAPHSHVGYHYHPLGALYVVVRGSFFFTGDFDGVNGSASAGELRWVRGGFDYGPEGSVDHESEMLVIGFDVMPAFTRPPRDAYVARVPVHATKVFLTPPPPPPRAPPPRPLRAPRGPRDPLPPDAQIEGFTLSADFPAILTKRDGRDWPEVLAAHRGAVLDALATYGAIVLKGARRSVQAAQSDAQRLEQVASRLFRLAPVEIGGVEGASRRHRVGGVNAPNHPSDFASSLGELPAGTADERSRSALWHQELAFYPCETVPHVLALACTQLPTAGGATHLTRSAELWKAVRGGLRRQLANSTHITVERVLKSDEHAPAGAPSWQDIFRTRDRAFVEGVCANRDWGVAWSQEGALELTIRTPLTRAHPRTGVTSWLNALPPALRLWRSVRFDDGRALEKADHLPELQSAFAESRPVEFEWDARSEFDILLIDNYAAVHAGPVGWTGARTMLQTYGWTSAAPSTVLWESSEEKSEEGTDQPAQPVCDAA